jgi:phage shock protein C
MDPFYRSPNPNRLFRNTAEGKIGGVCAGIADYTNTDSWIIRLGFIAGFFMFTPVFLFGYPLLWWILKPRPQQLFESSDEEKFWRSVTTRPEQTLAGLRAKFRTLDRQLSSIEGYVTSQEYALNRQFKDLEKR